MTAPWIDHELLEAFLQKRVHDVWVDCGGRLESVAYEVIEMFFSGLCGVAGANTALLQSANDRLDEHAEPYAGISDVQYAMCENIIEAIKEDLEYMERMTGEEMPRSYIEPKSKTGCNDTPEPAVRHTPGPWQAMFGSVYTNDEKTRLLQADRDEPNTSPTERDANIRLAAAAPDMLEALKHAANSFHHPNCTCKGEYAGRPDMYCTCHVQKARAAIAKATGGEQ